MMPNPFPGMDPYLEKPAHWSDFHARFVNCWCEAVARLLPRQYTARIGERVYLVEGPPVARRLILPDAAVERDPGPRGAFPAVATGTATLAPVTIPLIIPDEVRDTYIEILHRPDRSLVALLELLSPANKGEPGYRVYLAKRNALLLQNVHLVELDLLRVGHRVLLRDNLPPGDYYYLVSRGDRRPDCEVYPWPLSAPLPKVAVPLKGPDPDAIVDLAAVFALTCERGDYASDIDYALPPSGPLTEEQFQWIATCLGPRSAE